MMSYDDMTNDLTEILNQKLYLFMADYPDVSLSDKMIG